MASTGEQTFAVLNTETGSYTNVTVTTKTKDYIFILHASGMANIKIQDLPADVLKQLGYGVEENASKKSEVMISSKAIPELASKLKPLEKELEETILSIRQKLKLNSTAIYAVLGVSLILYLFSCFCCHLICIKANSPATILVWIPILQLIPLLRAAQMPVWLFLIWWVPVVPIIWALKIARARGKGILVGILLLLPVTNLLAFLYLAFSSEAPAPQAPKYKSMSLQTA